MKFLVSHPDLPFMVETWYADLWPWLDLCLKESLYQAPEALVLRTFSSLEPASFTSKGSWQQQGVNAPKIWTANTQPMVDKDEWKTPKLSTFLSWVLHHLPEFLSRNKLQLMPLTGLSHCPMSHMLQWCFQGSRHLHLDPGHLRLCCREWNCTKSHSCGRCSNMASTKATCPRGWVV